MLQLSYQSQFKRDVKKIRKQNKDVAELFAIIDVLQAGNTLPVANYDHSLGGNWKDCRECHIQPDWLLIYRIEDNELQLIRTGSHSELFG